MMPSSIIQLLAESEAKGEPVALCTIINSRGSTPRHEGSKMLVFLDGKTSGTVGGGEVENRVTKEALGSLKDGRPRLVDYQMLDPEQGDPGVCGGEVRVFIEPYLPRPLLVVVGGGHVGKAVCHLAKWLGFRVAISDDRPKLCSPEENPDAEEYYPCSMYELPSHLKITPNTYLVLTTRGSNVDIEGLPSLLRTEAAYIGVIGSKRRWLITRNGISESGEFSDDDFQKVHSPIGMAIRAETPEEIAISIMAEIILHRNAEINRKMPA
jgi:xanthine dehydrogenase accessory factor